MRIKFQVVAEPLAPAQERIADTGGQQQESQESIQKSIILYPVPVKDNLYIKLDEQENDVTLLIRAIQGQVVYVRRYRSGELNGSSINTSDLKPGVYLLHIVGDNRLTQVMKFIKE